MLKFILLAFVLIIAKNAEAADRTFEYVGNADGKIFVRPILDPDVDGNRVIWQRAREICVESGFRMASITSQAQEDVVAAYGKVDTRHWMWIDGSNFPSKTPEQWVSLNTGKNMTYFNWVKGRPVQGDVERRCIRWSRNSGESGWWDLKCTDTENVLCEIQASM